MLWLIACAPSFQRSSLIYSPMVAQGGRQCELIQTIKSTQSSVEQRGERRRNTSEDPDKQCDWPALISRFLVVEVQIPWESTEQTTGSDVTDDQRSQSPRYVDVRLSVGLAVQLMECVGECQGHVNLNKIILAMDSCLFVQVTASNRLKDS